MKFIVEQQTMEKIARYLGTRPFNEVALLLQEIDQTSKIFQEPKPDTNIKEPPTKLKEVPKAKEK